MKHLIRNTFKKGTTRCLKSESIYFIEEITDDTEDHYYTYQKPMYLGHLTAQEARDLWNKWNETRLYEKEE